MPSCSPSVSITRTLGKRILSFICGKSRVRFLLSITGVKYDASGLLTGYIWGTKGGSPHRANAVRAVRAASAAMLNR